jgi:hypothetical protein
LVNPPVPEIADAISVDTPSPKVNRYPCSSIAPAAPPTTDPTVSAAFKRNTAPAVFATVTATVSANALPPLNANTPEATVTPPVNVFVPLNVSTALPCCVNVPVPEITPE